VLFCCYLCCSMYCLCVNVYCTTATGWQPNRTSQIYHIISLSCSQQAPRPIDWLQVANHLYCIQEIPTLNFGPTQCILNGDASFLGCNAVLTGKRLPVSTAWRPRRCKSFNDTAAGTWNTRTVPWMSFSCCPNFLQAHGTNITFDSVHRLFRPLGTNYRSTQGCRGRRTDSVFPRT